MSKRKASEHAAAQPQPTSFTSAENPESDAASTLLQMAARGRTRKLAKKLVGNPLAAIAAAFAPHGRIAASSTTMSRGELCAFFSIARAETGRSTSTELAAHIIQQLRLQATDAPHLSRARSRIATDKYFAAFVRKWKLGYRAVDFEEWLERPWRSGIEGNDHCRLEPGSCDAQSSPKSSCAGERGSGGEEQSVSQPRVVKAGGNTSCGLLEQSVDSQPHAQVCFSKFSGSQEQHNDPRAQASGAFSGYHFDSEPGATQAYSRESAGDQHVETFSPGESAGLQEQSTESCTQASSTASRTADGIHEGDIRSMTGDRIAASQAGWLEEQFAEAEQELEPTVTQMKHGSCSFQLRCAEKMREFALAWVAYTQKSSFKEEHFGRAINNAEEVFVFPVATDAAKRDIRENAALFLHGWNTGVTHDEQVGLSSFAAMEGGEFMRELEIKIQIALRKYGERVGLSHYRRMVLHSISIIKFCKGRPPQHEHFDLLGSNCWAFVVNLSKCTCGKQCKFKGTRVFRKSGRGAPQLSPDCDPFADMIFSALRSGIPIDNLCELLPANVARSVRESFDAFGECVAAEAVRQAFVPDDARFGEVWGTNGMHGSPGNDCDCDRIVLFLAAAPEGKELYDGDTQTNGALVQGVYHGLFSLEYLQYVVETELVDGMPVTQHMVSGLNVSGKELLAMNVKRNMFLDTCSGKDASIEASHFWGEIVALVHETVHVGRPVPAHYRGQVSENGIIRVEGEDRHAVREVCADAYKILNCDLASERKELIREMAAKNFNRNVPPSVPAPRTCYPSGKTKAFSQQVDLSGWIPIAKVWQRARRNHKAAVSEWLREARDDIAARDM